MEPINTEIIKKIVEEFFEKSSFMVDIDIVDQQEGGFLINIKTDQPQILIGEKGQTLAEIQYLLKIILRKKIDQQVYISIDINEYKKKKTEYLKETAGLMADEVSLSKKEKILSPMPAYERRVVHLEIAKRQDVITESIGEGEERRLIIKPKN